MKNSGLWALWGLLFISCARLGFLPEPEGWAKAAFILMALLFFVPGFWLLGRGKTAKDRHLIQILRNLSLLSLGLTVALILANILSVFAPEAVGDALHVVLGIVSAPMFCGQSWVISLFLWASLAAASMMTLKELKNQQSVKGR